MYACVHVLLLELNKKIFKAFLPFHFIIHSNGHTLDILGIQSHRSFEIFFFFKPHLPQLPGLSTLISIVIFYWLYNFLKKTTVFYLSIKIHDMTPMFTLVNNGEYPKYIIVFHKTPCLYKLSLLYLSKFAKTLPRLCQSLILRKKSIISLHK